MNVDYKEILRRYIGTVRRYNVGEDFIDRLPLADQKVMNSLAPNVAHTEPAITSGNLSRGWFSNLKK